MRSISRPGAFVVYIGTHGDRGATRADVVLPGAAYPEKSANLRQHRRPGADGDARRVPARRCARGLGDSCGRCPTCWARSCPMTRCRNCARRCSPLIRIMQRIGQIAPGNAADLQKLAAMGGNCRQDAVALERRRFLFHQSDRALFGGHGGMFGAGARQIHHDGGGVGAHGRVLVRLYLAVGRHGGGERDAARHPADRRGLCAARRPQDLGGGADPPRPQRGRPVGTAAILRRSSQIRAQGAGDPGRRQQGRVPVGAARHLRAGARRLGGDSGRCRLGDRQHQCRHPLYLRHLLARRVRRDHGRLGVELKISVPRGAALGGADGVLRSLDRLRHHHRAAVRRLAQSHRHRRGAEQQMGLASAGTGCRCSR